MFLDHADVIRMRRTYARALDLWLDVRTIHICMVYIYHTNSAVQLTSVWLARPMVKMWPGGTPDVVV